MKIRIAIAVVLFVVAAVGLGIPMIGYIGEASPDARARRNAQSLASVSASASAAGIDFVNIANEKAGETADISEVIQVVAAGETATDGAFKGATFSVPGLSNEEQFKASTYLELAGGRLSYRSKHSLRAGISPPSKRPPGFHRDVIRICIVVFLFALYFIIEIILRIRKSPKQLDPTGHDR